MHVQKSSVLEDHYLKFRRLVCDFSILSNATPSLKIASNDLDGVLVIRSQGQTSVADAIEDLSLSFTAPFDNTAGDSTFGILLHGFEPIRKIYSIRVYEGTSLATSFAVTPLGSLNGLTADGNIAFEVVGTGLNLASESPSFRLEMEYLEF